MGGAVSTFEREAETLEIIRSGPQVHLLRNQAPGSNRRGMSMRCESRRHASTVEAMRQHRSWHSANRDYPGDSLRSKACPERSQYGRSEPRRLGHSPICMRGTIVAQIAISQADKSVQKREIIMGKHLFLDWGDETNAVCRH